MGLSSYTKWSFRWICICCGNITTHEIVLKQSLCSFSQKNPSKKTLTGLLAREDVIGQGHSEGLFNNVHDFVSGEYLTGYCWECYETVHDY